MKLVLLSGGQQANNLNLHQAAVEMAKKLNPKKALSFTYIPSCHDHHELYYHRMARRYQRLGVKKFICLNVDQKPSQAEIKTALQSHLVYVAGGNTFYLLKHLKKSGVFEKLKKFVKNDGVLVGLSAGGLIMCPTVKLAADERIGPDDPEPGFRSYSGMNLVPFEFSPHFEGRKKEIQAHLQYSQKTKHPVYAVKDGGGMVINDELTTLYGECFLFHRGKQMQYG